jgi:hypothetical protein
MQYVWYLNVAEDTGNKAGEIRKFATDSYLEICVPHSQIYLPSFPDLLSTLCHCVNEIHFTTECNFQEVGYTKHSTAYLQKIRC